MSDPNASSSVTVFEPHGNERRWTVDVRANGGKELTHFATKEFVEQLAAHRRARLFPASESAEPT